MPPLKECSVPIDTDSGKVSLIHRQVKKQAGEKSLQHNTLLGFVAIKIANISC